MILAIWIPQWPLQRLLLKRPDLQNQPVVIYQKTSRGPCVLVCSDRLVRWGVSLGMPVAEALALGRRQQSQDRRSTRREKEPLHLEPHNPVEDRKSLVRLAQWCHRFSPIVGLEEETFPETLLLDVTGMDLFAGSEDAFITQVGEQFRTRGIFARLGWGPTLGNAWALAHYSSDCAETEIEDLPVEALRLPVKTQQILGRLGLGSLKDLLSLPRAELQNVAGAILLQRLDQAMGRVSEVIRAISSPHHFSVFWQTEHGLLQRESIEHVIQHQAADLCQSLKNRSRGALCIVCRIQCQDSVDLVFRMGLFLPCADEIHLQRLFKLQLESLALPAPVMSISLSVLQDAPLVIRQRELFANRISQSEQDLAGFVDCLNSRLGTDCVLRVFLQNDAQPENAYREEPLLEGRATNYVSSVKGLPFSCLGRPLSLIAPPVRLPVAAEEVGQLPRYFSCALRRHQVYRSWGPERIETGWWRRNGIRRDYYRVETTEGLRFWIFCCLQTGDWFLQGVFD